MALQSNRKLFLKFRNNFLNELHVFVIIVVLGLCMRGEGGICDEQHAF